MVQLTSLEDILKQHLTIEFYYYFVIENGFDGSDDVSNRSDAFQRRTRNEGLADGLGHDDVGQSELFSKSDHEEGGFPLRVPSRSVVIVEKEKQFGLS